MQSGNTSGGLVRGWMKSPPRRVWPDFIFRNRDLGYFLVFEVAYYIGVPSCNVPGQKTASPFWYPDAVLLSTLLVTRQSRWWLYLLGPLPIRLFLVHSSNPFWFLLATFANDSLKGLPVCFVASVLFEESHTLRHLAGFSHFRRCRCIVVAGNFGL